MAGPVERVFAAQPFASAGQRVIVSPFQFATSDDDNLQIVSANSLPGVVLAVQGRRVTTQGAVEPFSYTHTPNSDRSTRTQNFKLGGGALLNLTIFASSGTPRVGQTYVSARIIRGLFGATLVLGGLLGGYVTAAQPLAFPGSPIVPSLEGEPVLIPVTGTMPAAGVEITETVPAGARWDLLTMNCQLVTSAVAGARRVSLAILGSGGTVAQCLATADLAAASTGTFTFAPGLTPADYAARDLHVSGLPQRVLLRAGDQFSTVTYGLLGGDQYSQPRYFVREWLEVQS